VVRYGDLVELASQIGEKSRGRGFTTIRSNSSQTFGLLRSHLPVICKDLKDPSTLLCVYDFTVRSRRQQARDNVILDRLPSSTLKEFLLDPKGEPLSNFLLTEDTTVATAMNAHRCELSVTSRKLSMVDGSTSLRL